MTESAALPVAPAPVATARRALRSLGPAFVLTAAATLLGVWLIRRHDIHTHSANIYRYLIFDHLFLRFDVPGAKLFAAVIVAAAVAALRMPARWVERPLAWIGDHPVPFAVGAGVALAVLAPIVYQDYPLSLDEFWPVQQAKIFAAGHIYGKYPPTLVDWLIPIPGIDNHFSRVTGEFVSTYWVTFPLLLTPFTKLGVPWLLNPLAGIGVLLCVGYLARQFLPDRPLAPGWAMLLCLASPVFTVNALSYYSMNMHLLASLAYAALFCRPTPRRLFLAGLVGSVALCLNNPVPHGIFAVPWILWVLWQPGRARNILWLGLGYLPSVVLVFGWLHVQETLAHAPPTDTATAAAATAPSDLWAALMSRLGAGFFTWPTRAMLRARAMWALKLVLWAVPGLVVLAVAGYRYVRGVAVARLFMWSTLATLTLYFFVIFDQGHGWGFRYFHTVWAVLPLFAAAWLTSAPDGPRWGRFTGALALGSLLLMTPERMWQVHSFISEAISMSPTPDPTRQQVIFVDPRAGDPRYYAWDAIRNDPFLRGPTVRIRADGPDADRETIQRWYPGAQMISNGPHGSVWNRP